MNTFYHQVDRIRTSLEEIINRLRNNLKNIQNDVEGSVSELLMQLYEKNKENLILSRQDVRSSKDLAEVSIIITISLLV